MNKEKAYEFVYEFLGRYFEEASKNWEELIDEHRFNYYYSSHFYPGEAYHAFGDSKIHINFNESLIVIAGEKEFIAKDSRYGQALDLKENRAKSEKTMMTLSIDQIEAGTMFDLAKECYKFLFDSKLIERMS